MIRHRPRFSKLVLALLALALLALPAAASARGGDDEVRAERACGGGVEAELRLEADDGAIEVELRIDSRGGQLWSVALVHERRVAWRGSGRTRRGSGELRIRRTLPDYAGADELRAVANGPRGVSCQVTATLPG